MMEALSHTQGGYLQGLHHRVKCICPKGTGRERSEPPLAVRLSGIVYARKDGVQVALPASNTERWFLQYSVGGHQHTMMMRTEEGTSSTDVSDAFDEFLTQIAPGASLITIVGLEVAAVNSDVRNPSVWGGDATYGTGTPPAGYDPVELTFTGRTTGGHKARVSFFGYDGSIPDDFRLGAGDDANVDAARATLSANPGRWIAIDGLSVIWHPYANVGFNDHWVKVQRTSGA